MKGDRITVQYTTPAEKDVTEVILVEIGGRRLSIEEPNAKNPWFVVTEQTRAGRTTRKLRVRGTSVTSVFSEFNEEE